MTLSGGEVVVCGCDETFQTVGEFGDHRDGCTASDSFDVITMSDEANTEILQVSRIGPVAYLARFERDAETAESEDPSGPRRQFARVDLSNASVDIVGANQTTVGAGGEDEILEYIMEVHDDLEDIGSDNLLTAMAIVNSVSGAVPSGAAPTAADGAGGAGGDDGGSFDGEVFEELETDDSEELVEKVEQWLKNFSAVKSDMIEGGYSAKYGRITDPEDGSSEDGVYIDVAPFYAGSDIWDSKNNKWADDDAQEKFADHRAALTGDGGVLREDIVEAVVDDSGEYNDWFNYVPASKAAELGE